jgi:intracellular multiplication protein IcmS
MTQKQDLQQQQETIVKQIVAIANTIGCQYTINNEVIAAEKAFAVTGLLPAIMRRADQLSSFCLGYGLGITFERADGSMLGVAVYFDNKVAISVRLLCATDVILELVHASSSSKLVALDSLMEE